ncbi:hypothetical protein [Deinococcus radiotolerans]|uniref:Uncharacterized protein n=1 Tax=Deinococcus radiotolerans TaxID=1309407 RepID=A0ABQ2FQ56_9DEIO|nr:hypothetical protein [Deinococcus radiotolerans]GGL15942.1 hypothetical protein GCM10010844_38540 [Deinococcus radiotolerans]
MIGTATSFPAATFCKLYTCEHQTTVPLSSTLKSYTYGLRPESPGLPASQAFVLRDGTKVVSAGLWLGAQDWPFSETFFETSILSDLIGLATGKRPANTWTSKLKCRDIDDGGAALNTFQGVNRAYTVACVTSPGRGFVNFNVSVY